MDTNLLYYKELNQTILPEDYVNWAVNMLENNVFSPSLTILATLKGPLNMFEVKQYFQRTIEELQYSKPTLNEMRNAYVHDLCQQIQMNQHNILECAYEIYRVLRDQLDFKQISKWYDISEMIDDFRYGDNFHKYTYEQLTSAIQLQAEEYLIESASK